MRNTEDEVKDRVVWWEKQNVRVHNKMRNMWSPGMGSSVFSNSIFRFDTLVFKVLTETSMLELDYIFRLVKNRLKKAMSVCGKFKPEQDEARKERKQYLES